ncbi:MAG: toll/interleukin-1 receptor domain-containing protein [Hyphomonadaceae bacterium]
MERAGEAAERPVRVFISYARADIVLVRALAEALHAYGYFADYDLGGDEARIDGGLSPSDDWWKRLQDNIAAADVVIFVVSPEASTSSVCDDEIKWAQDLGKRIIPIVARRIDFQALPKRLSSLNLSLPFSEAAGTAHLPFESFDVSFRRLVAAIEIDLDWLREGARITALALTWVRNGRPAWALARAGAISQADQWAARRPPGAAPPGEMVQEFLSASRAKEESDRTRLRSITGRAFVRPAAAAIEAGHFDSALRIMATGAYLAEDPHFELVPELFDAGARAIAETRLRGSYQINALVSALIPLSSNSVATFDDEGEIRFWDLRTGDAGVSRQISNVALRSACFIAGSNEFLVGDDAGIVHRLSAGGTPVEQWQVQDKAVQTLCVDHSGRTVLVGGAAYDLETKTLIHNAVRPHAGPPTSALSSCGRWIAIADRRQIRIHEVRTGRETIAFTVDYERNHTLRNTALCFTPDSDRLLAIYEDGRLGDSNVETVWIETETGVLSSANWKLDRVPSGLSISSDGKRALLRYPTYAAVWHIDASERTVLIAAAPRTFDGAIFSGNARQVFTWSAGDFQAWSVWRTLCVARLAHEGVRTYDVSVAADAGQILISDERGVRLIAETDYALLAEAPPGGLGRRADMARDGSAYVHATAYADAIEYMSIKDDVRRTFTRPEASKRKEAIEALKISPDGKRIAFSEDSVTESSSVFVLNCQDGSLISTLAIDAPRATVLAFDPSGHLLAMGVGPKVEIWDVLRGAIVQTFGDHETHVSSIDWSRCGRFLVSTGGLSVRLWDRETGNLIRSRRAPPGEYMFTSVAFAPDARTIAIGVEVLGNRSSLRILHRETLRELMHVGSLSESIRSLAFGRTGKILYAHYSNDDVRAWDVGRAIALGGRPHEILAASLRQGLGRRLPSEADDFLMNESPADAYEALTDTMDRDALAHVTQIGAALSEEPHANCFGYPIPIVAQAGVVVASEPVAPALEGVPAPMALASDTLMSSPSTPMAALTPAATGMVMPVKASSKRQNGELLWIAGVILVVALVTIGWSQTLMSN